MFNISKKTKQSMVSALKDASKLCIAFRLTNFLHPFIIRFVIFQKNFELKKSPKLDVLEKTEARFGFSTQNYPGNDISLE